MQKTGTKTVKKTAGAVKRSRKVTPPRRRVTFKVIDQDKRALVARPFDTTASDEELDKYVDASIERMREAQDIFEKRPDVRKLYVGNGARQFTWYLRDSMTNETVEVYTLSLLPSLAKGVTLESLRAEMLRNVEAYWQSVVGSIYKAMVAYMNQKHWGSDSMKIAARWREVCACHPLYLSGVWDEKRKREFEKTARESIKAGVASGRYKITPSRMEGVSSRKKPG